MFFTFCRTTTYNQFDRRGTFARTQFTFFCPAMIHPVVARSLRPPKHSSSILCIRENRCCRYCFFFFFWSVTLPLTSPVFADSTVFSFYGKKYVFLKKKKKLNHPGNFRQQYITTQRPRPESFLDY